MSRKKNQSPSPPPGAVAPETTAAPSGEDNHAIDFNAAVAEAEAAAGEPVLETMLPGESDPPPPGSPERPEPLKPETCKEYLRRYFTSEEREILANQADQAHAALIQANEEKATFNANIKSRITGGGRDALV